MPVAADRYEGTLLGLALGDALGAPHEGGPLERLVWRAFGRTRSGQRRWTDDTQMSLDLAASFLAQGRIDSDDLAARFAASYRWSRGYGPGTAKILRRIARGTPWRQAAKSVYREGSYGNGAAMRAPVVGLLAADNLDQLDDWTTASAIVTHAHEFAIIGAQLIARATAQAAMGLPSRAILNDGLARCIHEAYRTRLAIAQEWLLAERNVTPREVSRALGNGVAAADSCVTALYLALRFRDREFLTMHQSIAAGRGDVDTIGAMAGAIWGAANGSAGLPEPTLATLEDRARISAVAQALCAKSAELTASRNAE